jgi:hypothetical protein
MYTPAGGETVPVAKVEWSYSATVVMSPNDPNRMHVWVVTAKTHSNAEKGISSINDAGEPV